MNLCTSTRRKVTTGRGTAWQFGHGECGAPATHVKDVSAAHHDYSRPVYHCEEHAGEGFTLIDEEPAEKMTIEPRGTVYGTRTHRQWARVINGTVYRFELLGPSAHWKSGPTVRVTRHPYGRYQEATIVHERLELAGYVDGMEDTRPCVGDRGHFMGRCVECDAARVIKMTPDDVESWYRSGHFGQAQYEAFMHAWATSAPRHSAGGWMEAPTDPEVVAIVAAIRRHAGIPAPVELAA